MRAPFIDDGDVQLYLGDALEVLRELPEESAHCVVTSPPYWGLRDYGTEGQLGLEATPDEYVAAMVEVFREVRRVMRHDASAWVNLGDSFADKQLQMIPARLALALQADGWYLRSEITWCKPNAMPESVTDRPSGATEKVYLLAKNPRYYFDAEAIRRPHQHDGRTVTTVTGRENSHQYRDGERWPGTGANERNWWLIPTQPFPSAHFATYPEELVRRCVLAGTSEHGCCPECGAPWVREVEVELVKTPGGSDINPPRGTEHNWSRDGKPRRTKLVTTTGWQPSCECLALAGLHPENGEPIPCTVLDPFFGSGTTGLVARKHGRRSIGIELSPEYVKLAARRLSQLSLLAEPA